MTNKQFDTNRYLGHTEGPWWINREDGDGATSIWNGNIDEGNMNHVADVDAHENDLILMAEAPKILQALVDEQEKVKHLLSKEKVQEMMTAYGRDLNREIDVLRECIADIANNMEAADDSYMSGFIEDLRKAMKK